MSGVLVIDKPKGWTSHDVVARVRKDAEGKEGRPWGNLGPAGHRGSCRSIWKRGPNLFPSTWKGTKGYRATMKLGQETDTLDADGKITAKKRGSPVLRKMIEKSLEKFRGAIRQIPPLFSAIKHRGLPLYKRARAGERPKVAEETGGYDSRPMFERVSPPLWLPWKSPAGGEPISEASARTSAGY